MNAELEDFITDLFRMSNIPTYRIPLPYEDWSWFDRGLRTTILGASPARWAEYMNRNLQRLGTGTVYHYTDPFHCSYTLMKLTDTEALIMGPFLFEPVRERRFEALFSTLGLPQQAHTQLLHYFASIAVIPDQALYEGLVVLTADRLFGKRKYKVTYRDAETLSEFMQMSDISVQAQQPMESVELAERQRTLEDELMQAVINGNEALAQDKAVQLVNLITSRHMTNELREAKNGIIILDTLLRKAAEFTGVHPLHITSLFESYLEKAEQLTAWEQGQTVVRKMVRDYCHIVKDLDLKAYAQPVGKIITCVRTDLTADLSLRYFAKTLNVNASYLSALFKKEMGLSLTEYVNNARIDHAKILLSATDLPVKTIAIRCGIQDLRYFSRVFRNLTGETPSAYRANNVYGKQK